eukprot:8898760-Alexandrium_andersonii.AAC.1
MQSFDELPPDVQDGGFQCDELPPDVFDGSFKPASLKKQTCIKTSCGCERALAGDASLRDAVRD